MKKITAIMTALLLALLSAVPAAAASDDGYTEPTDALVLEDESATDSAEEDAEPAQAELPAEAQADSDISHTDEGPVSTAAVPYPDITKVNPSASGFTLTWSSYPGAYKYRLFIRKPDDSGWKKVGDTFATTYSHTGLVSNTDYRYTVRALDSKGNFMSDYNKTGFTIRFFSVPVLKTVENVNTGQKLSWNPVPGAVNYRIYVKTTGSWEILGYSTGSTYVNTQAESDTTYTYTVRCCTADGKQLQSNFNGSGLKLHYIAAPQITSFTPVEDGTKVSWEPVKGAAAYRLFIRKPDNSGWKKVGDTTGADFTHTGLTDGTLYMYTVRALDSKSNFISGYNSAGWVNLYLAAPELSSVSYSDGAYKLSWSAEPDAAGYRLYRKSFGGSWKTVCTVYGSRASSFTDKKATPGELCAYTLRYIDSDGEPMSWYRDDVRYYIDGVPAEGEFDCGSDTIFFNDGYIRQGYVKLDGKTYYYDSTGKLIKNDIVGSKAEGYTYADENGVCCVSKEIKLAAEFMMTYAKGDTLDERMKTGFLYLAKNIPYNRTYDHLSKASEMAALAIDMFTNKKGNCFRYAACFACMAKIAGYRSRVVIGTTIGNPHGWVEVLVDGKWLICDPDAQIPSYHVPDYKAYMMEKHYWQLTPKTRCEITIDENGVAVWK